MTDITLISGTNRNLEVTLVDNQTVPEPIDLTLVDSVVWEVFRGHTPILKKNLDDGITVTDATNGEILIVLLDDDTKPEADVANTYYNANYYGTALPGPILGSTSRRKHYRHESRLVFADGTQEVPGSFRGRLRIDPTDTYGES